jgi:hypothetical protein
MGQLTLKITVQNGSNATTLRLEGRVVGPWVNELDRTWRGLAPSLGSKKLSVDLRGVTYVDQAGRDLLADIHNEADAELLADTPLTKYFAEEAEKANRKLEMKGA